MQFLQELMLALGRPAVNPVSPLYFQWPLVSRPGADVSAPRAREVLAGFIDRCIRETGPEHLVLLGERASEYVQAEGERLDSELSMIRYISWAIPSIGFIGTVRGIGEALAQADKAVQGDIAGVTQSLGVAFNSTFIALLISIVLMFLLHQLQLRQERLVLDAEGYVDEHLLQHLQA